MINKYMGAIPNRELTSVGCGQEARRLLEELKGIVYGLILSDYDFEKNVKKEIFDLGTDELKEFMVKNIKIGDHWKVMETKLEELVKVQGEKGMGLRALLKKSHPPKKITLTN
ncbi:pol polyprotein [Vairimorpha necatrix]|uniref:Pol polyprotein n=1 Tax=Vairimorpha necatrix TaxID=6039 RepID=A0AAX4JD28_9MICR